MVPRHPFFYAKLKKTRQYIKEKDPAFHIRSDLFLERETRIELAALSLGS